MPRLILILLAILAALLAAQAATAAHPEAYYQRAWCDAAQGAAYRLPDRTEVDCLTDTHAIEFDWGAKWAEAIGQSLHYAQATGKRAGIILILRKRIDVKRWRRLVNAINVYGLPIDAWPIWTRSLSPSGGKGQGEGAPQ